MKKRMLLALFPALVFCGCNSGNEKIGPQTLIGTWQEQQEPAFAYDVYNITLKPDSFYIKINREDDGRIPNHPCGNLQVSHVDYAMGTYTVSNDTLQFNGLYVDGCRQPQKDNCYSVGLYPEKFKFSYQGADLILQPLPGKQKPFRLTRDTPQPWPCEALPTKGN